jgi:hypothetical protein
MGNLLPALICVPFLIVGLVKFKQSDPTASPAIWFLLGFPVVGWLSLNLLGFYQNSFMKRELARRLGLFGVKDLPEHYFVGIARPRFRSALDPHEDVGYLVLHPDRVEFLGESVQVGLDKKNVKRIRFRSNPHTFVLLGRWVSVEGEVGGTPVRLLIEPREKGTLLGNLFFSERLRERLDTWKDA